MSIFSIGAILVGFSALFGYINHRLFHLPHTIGLVVIALLASLSIIGLDLITPSFQIGQRVSSVLRMIDFNETLMHGMLSFLMFAGALHADFSAIKNSRLTIRCDGSLWHIDFDLFNRSFNVVSVRLF